MYLLAQRKKFQMVSMDSSMYHLNILIKNIFK